VQHEVNHKKHNWDATNCTNMYKLSIRLCSFAAIVFYVNVLIIATKLLLLGLCCNLAYYVAGVMFINLGFLCALTVPPTTTMMSTVEMLSTSPRK